MRKHGKSDKNQKQIVADLRKLGFLVAITSQLGDGRPDILVSKLGQMIWFELKSEKGKLTPAEAKFHAAWERAPIRIARTLEEIIEYFSTLQ